MPLNRIIVGIGLAATIAGLVSGLPTGSRAAVVISKDPTANVTCAAGVCKATAEQAVLNATDLANMLAAGDVSVEPGFMAKDVEVSAAFGWVSTHRLTLDAYRAITIGKTVSVTGTGALTLTISDGGKGGVLTFADLGRIEFWDLASDLEIQGNTYVLVKNVKTLAKLIKKNHSGYFALANNYDAAKDGTYDNSPIQKLYGGVFDGLGNAINNLSIRSYSYPLGLFANLGQSATIRDLRLVNVDIVDGQIDGYIGGLVGSSSGTIDDSYVSGLITVANVYFVGGLVGRSTGLIERSASDADITSSAYSGGLVGDNEGVVLQSFATGSIATSVGASGALASFNLKGTIDQSYATGDVTGQSAVGGLVAMNENGTVSNSYATGKMTGSDFVGGGLVGENDGKVIYSYATASVYMFGFDPFYPATSGGLVGWNRLGEIDHSFASGAVSSNFFAGGLAGINGGDQNNKDKASIHQSFATGPVSALGSNAQVGGFAGANTGVPITDSYATGSVTALDNANAGAFVGTNANDPLLTHDAAISNCYASGHITWGSQSSVGGVIGSDLAAGTTTNCYWDLDTTGISDPAQGAGNVRNDAGLMGLTTPQFQSGLPAGFDPAIWAQAPGVNGGYPYLIAVPPPGQARAGRSMRFSNSFRTSRELRRKFLEAAAQLRKDHPLRPASGKP